MPCHLTAHLTAVEVLDPEQASYLWSALRRGFPDALSAVLLPDHLHTVPDSEAVRECRRRLAAVLSGVTRHWQWSGRQGALEWRLAPGRALGSNRDHLARDIRYLALNPCRAGLVRDPLEWPWSTHRDVVGAVVDPWVSATRLAAALGRSVKGFVRAHHAYVSADSSVHPDGTRLPCAATPSMMAVGIEHLCAAALAATRARAASLQTRSAARRLFVALAYRYHWGKPGVLAQLCQTSMETIRVLRHASVDRGALAAAELCLGDPRLLAATAREAARLCAALESVAGTRRREEVMAMAG